MGKPPDVDSCAKDRLVARVQRLQSNIDILRAEVNQLRSFGAQTRKRRKDEIGRLRRNLNGKSRELWLKMQKMRRFGNLAQCKKLLMYPRDPSHDISSKTLTAEAKLLLAQRQGGMVDHQSDIVQKFQKEMIDYLYITVLPHIKDEQRMATVIGQIQLDKLMMEQQRMIRLFEECLGIRRAIFLKYKLRDMAHVYSRPASPGALSVGNNSISSHGARSTSSRRMGLRSGSVSPIGNYSTASRRHRHVSANSPEQRSPQRRIVTNGQATSPRNIQATNSPPRRQTEKSELLEKAKLARILIMEKSNLRDDAKSPGRPPFSPTISPTMLREENNSISSLGIPSSTSRRVGQGDDSESSPGGGASFTSRRLGQGGDPVSPNRVRSSSNTAKQSTESGREPGSATRRFLTNGDNSTGSPHNIRSSASSRAKIAAKAKADLLERSKPLRLHDSSDLSATGSARSSPRQTSSSDKNSPTARTRQSLHDHVSSATKIPSKSPLGRPRRSPEISPASGEKIVMKSPGRHSMNNGDSSMEKTSKGSSSMRR